MYYVNDTEGPQLTLGWRNQLPVYLCQHEIYEVPKITTTTSTAA